MIFIVRMLRRRSASFTASLNLVLAFFFFLLLSVLVLLYIDPLVLLVSSLQGVFVEVSSRWLGKNAVSFDDSELQAEKKLTEGRFLLVSPGFQEGDVEDVGAHDLGEREACTIGPMVYPAL